MFNHFCLLKIFQPVGIFLKTVTEKYFTGETDRSSAASGKFKTFVKILITRNLSVLYFFGI